MIRYIEASRVFVIDGANSSYVIGIAKDGDLMHMHWGAMLDHSALDAAIEKGFSPPKEGFKELQSREYPDFAHNDLRLPAFLCEHADGSRLNEFQYERHAISGEILAIVLFDPVTRQHLELRYQCFPERDIIVRNTAITQGPQGGRLRRLMSASLDLPEGDYRALSLYGAWIKERTEQWTPIPRSASVRFESRRGISSHEMSPFVALGRGDFGEEHGEVYGITPVSSGNWLIEVDGHSSGRVRVNAGLNDFDFNWSLDDGEHFTAPETVLCYSPEGLGGLSRRLHRHVNSQVIPRAWRGKERPVLINSWEAFYFGFRHEDIVRLAQEAKALGVEMLVLDDGWFGRRDDDKTSMGDWFERKDKLPKGIRGLSEEIHGLGMKFGLWFEPEAISPQSELYKKHPDWALHVRGRAIKLARTQMVLDLSRPEVRDYLWERIDHFVREGKLDYIKWDMNRALWEVGSPALPPKRQAELSHRFTLGVYELMARLRDTHPHVLVEGCAGGGARFDYGVLSHQPQFWASDNTDALDRIKIQWGGSYFLPPFAMGSHISTVPNHQTQRVIPIEFRAHVAMAGNLGLELNLSQVPEADKVAIKKHVAEYKAIRGLLQKADFYRLESPYASGRAAWIFVSEDKREAVLFVYQMKAGNYGPVKLRGLDPALKYNVDSQSLNPELPAGDFKSHMLRIQAKA